MEVFLVNSPWLMTEEEYGVKAGARWPSIRKKAETLQYYPFPFFMAYATSYLKEKGIAARCLDAIAEGLSLRQTLDILLKEKPSLVVIETSTPSIYDDIEFARQIKEHLDCFIAFAGPHSTALPEEVLSRSVADIVLLGEYEFTLLEVARAILERNFYQKSHLIKGIAYKEKDGSIKVNERRELIKDLDELPYPERDDLPLYKYTDPVCKRFPNLCIISSRGCPHRCIFCVEPSVYYGKPNLRLRQPAKIVDEIEYVMQRFFIREIYFDDSSFTLNRAHARAISEEILRRKLDIYWSCMADVNVDEETLKLMYKSGCRGVKFGVESADEGILKAIRKPINLQRVKEFVALCKKMGIFTHGTFMLGLPGETKETLKKTIKFAFSLKTTTLQFALATPLPGTEFFKMAKDNGWLITEDWRKFEGSCSPVIQYADLSADDLLKAILSTRRKKMVQLLRSPSVFFGYIKKIYDTDGAWGLVKDLSKKGLFVLKGLYKD